MKYELRKLNLDMGVSEYEMYQDIPSKESGSTNLCKGLPYEVFMEYLEREMAREYQSISLYDTPTVTYLMYVNDKPIGLIGLRMQIDDNWKLWSGNFYFRVRLSERGKGYATKMVSFALNEFRKLNYKEVFANASKNNIASSKILENNGGILLKEEDGRKYYKFNIKP